MSTPTGKVGWSSDTQTVSERGLSWFERGRAAVRAASDSLDDGCDIREVLAEHGVSVYENARGKNVFVIDTSSGERRILGWKLLGKKWDTWFAWRLLAEEQSGEPADAAAGTPESHWQATVSMAIDMALEDSETLEEFHISLAEQGVGTRVDAVGNYVFILGVPPTTLEITSQTLGIENMHAWVGDCLRENQRR